MLLSQYDMYDSRLNDKFYFLFQRLDKHGLQAVVEYSTQDGIPKVLDSYFDPETSVLRIRLYSGGIKDLTVCVPTDTMTISGDWPGYDSDSQLVMIHPEVT